MFLDEGPPMAQLLREAAARGIMPAYTRALLAAFDGDARDPAQAQSPLGASPRFAAPGRAAQRA